MGADTKAIIRKGTTLEQIENALSAKYSNVQVINNNANAHLFRILLDDKNDKRTLWASFDDLYERDCGLAGVGLSLGHWGNSIEIMKYLCETFGGYIDESDCDNEGFYPIGLDLYENGVKELTKMEEFRHKVVSKLGYNNLKMVMELFNEYKSI